MKKKINLLFLVAIIMMLSSCGGNSNSSDKQGNDSVEKKEQVSENKEAVDNGPVADENQINAQPVSPDKIVNIYNFHLVNRCPSCIAIEKATLKTISTYFKKQQDIGQIRFTSLNVEAEANKALAEKYEASGSSLFVTGTVKGKETTYDLTADGFKYAKNNEEKFISILKAKISELLN